jgi:Arylsulfatase A and related enzymes
LAVEGPDDEAESKRIRNIFHRDGGTQKTYAIMVQSLDVNIGRVLQALDASGLAGNTIVVFTSDNGGERFSKTWPFSGMKTDCSKAAFVSRGRALAGADCGGIGLRASDDHDGLGADAARAAGTAPDAAYPSDGEDLGPIVTGRAAPHSRKLYWRYKAGSQRAVRDGDWKYLRIAGNDFSSMWSRTHVSGAISRIGRKTSSIG